MSQLVIFAIGFFAGAMCVGFWAYLLVRDSLKYIAFRNPSDLIFYQYEEQRLRTDRKKWWTLPVPFMKKHPVGVRMDVEADMKAQVESRMNADDEAKKHAEKVQKQREEFAKNRRPAPL